MGIRHRQCEPDLHGGTSPSRSLFHRILSRTIPDLRFLTAKKAHLPLVLGREFGIDNANPICMEEPVLHVLCFTEFYLRQFGGLPPISSLDVDRTLADFSFVPVFAKHIFHKPSDIACHASFLFSGGNHCPLSKRTAR